MLFAEIVNRAIGMGLSTILGLDWPVKTSCNSAYFAPLGSITKNPGFWPGSRGAPPVGDVIAARAVGVVGTALEFLDGLG